MDGRKFCCRILFYVLGLFVMAFGVTFAANSNLGMSPVNSIPAVLSAITNIEMGTCVIIIFFLFIVAQILIKRRQFRLIDLTQLIFSTIFVLWERLGSSISILADRCQSRCGKLSIGFGSKLAITVPVQLRTVAHIA